MFFMSPTAENEAIKESPGQDDIQNPPEEGQTKDYGSRKRMRQKKQTIVGEQ